MNFRNLAIATILTVAAFNAAAQAPAPAPAPAKPGANAGCVKEKLTTESLVAELLDEAAAKEVLIKHVPELKGNEQFEMARPMPLRAIQAYAADTFTDKIMDAIDADLAKLPICK